MKIYQNLSDYMRFFKQIFFILTRFPKLTHLKIESFSSPSRIPGIHKRKARETVKHRNKILTFILQ